MNVQLLIAAAGSGTRLGADRPKALVNVLDTPLLVLTLARLAPLDLINDAVVLAPPTHIEDFEATLAHHFPDSSITVTPGGQERQDSIENGLNALKPETQIVVIHDAARPFVPFDSVTASIEAATECGAATVAIPSIDTILVGDTESFLVDTPDRTTLWACQTPQTFRVSVIRAAHDRARQEGHLGTDDASLVRRVGGRVKLVPGGPLNFKVTTPEDLKLASLILLENLA